MIEVKAPDAYHEHRAKPSAFLAGSIEMGVAEDWQAKIAQALAAHDILILNPRRAAWDSSWEQSINNPFFREQVEWELDALDAADVVVMYFVPETKSPVTLLELGLHAAKNPEKIIVCCPNGFWRKGNVDIVCRRHGVQVEENLDDLTAALVARLSKKKG
jgi:hypothetical protein